LLNLDKSTMILWVKEYHATGKQAAKPMGGRRRFALLGEREWLLVRIAAAPDLTGRTPRAELAARGIKVSYDAVWRFLREERLTFKKSLPAAEQNRPDVARKRERWKRHQRRIDPARLVFVDETWSKTNMTRKHGRALRGECLVAPVPCARTVSSRLTCLTARSTAACSWPGCSSASCPPCGRATSSCSTT
jgi:transposase